MWVTLCLASNNVGLTNCLDNSVSVNLSCEITSSLPSVSIAYGSIAFGKLSSFTVFLFASFCFSTSCVVVLSSAFSKYSVFIQKPSCFLKSDAVSVLSLVTKKGAFLVTSISVSAHYHFIQLFYINNCQVGGDMKRLCPKVVFNLVKEYVIRNLCSSNNNMLNSVVWFEQLQFDFLD